MPHYFWYLGVLLLVCDNAFDNQINGIEIGQSYDKPCITPDDQPGYCVNLINCTHLYTKLGKFPLAPQVATFLRKSRCGDTAEKTPKVCCSVSKSTDISRPDGNLENEFYKVGGNDTGCGKINKASWKMVGGWNSTLDTFQQTNSVPKIQGQECEKYEFKCDNGQCIDELDLCNGKLDCEDGSDETCHHCSNKMCNLYDFRCDYGACLFPSEKCDGSKQCRDGSDESLRACDITIDETEKRKLLETVGDFCTVLVPTPDKTITYKCSEKDSQTCGKSGIVRENTVALIKCNTGYYTIENKTSFTSVCNKTNWVPPIADCFTPAAYKNKVQRDKMDPCAEFEFICDNGQCIYDWFLCDGISDCADKSDETHSHCSVTRCGKGKFRCHYGGCIDEKYRCDGLKQCNDGSDEAPSMCNANFNRTSEGRVEANGNSCATLPPSLDKTITYTCGENMSRSCEMNGFAPEHTVAFIQCNPGYFPTNNATKYQSHCSKTKWVPQINECLKKCDQLTPMNVDLRCYYKGISIPCTGNTFFAGTKIRPKCKPFYTYEKTYSFGIEREYTELTCDHLGKWNPDTETIEKFKLVSCSHECDQQFIEQKLIRVGVKELQGKSPWHVAIYNRMKLLICGGSIIRPKIVLSAAHCFYSEETNGEVNVTDYEIVVGKITRDYSLVDNEEQKSFKIRELRFSEKGYIGYNNNFAADIVIIILEQSITFSKIIQPAMYDPKVLYSGNPPEGQPGKVSGWGLDDKSDFSKELMTTNLTFISRDDCLKIEPVDIQRFITFDKFCAGSNTDNGSTVLQGDSGGGILLRYGRDYYIQGIVSVKEISLRAISAFTDLADHAAWISSVVEEVYNYFETKKKLRMEQISRQKFYTESSECQTRRKNRKLMEARMSSFLNARNRNFSESRCPEFSNPNTPPFSEAYAWLLYLREKNSC